MRFFYPYLLLSLIAIHKYRPVIFRPLRDEERLTCVSANLVQLIHITGNKNKKSQHAKKKATYPNKNVHEENVEGDTSLSHGVEFVGKKKTKQKKHKKETSALIDQSEVFDRSVESSDGENIESKMISLKISNEKIGSSSSAGKLKVKKSKKDGKKTVKEDKSQKRSHEKVVYLFLKYILQLVFVNITKFK